MNELGFAYTGIADIRVKRRPALRIHQKMTGIDI